MTTPKRHHRTLVCQFFAPKIALNAVICMITYIFLDNGVMTTPKRQSSHPGMSIIIIIIIVKDSHSYR